ncbi:ABC transporter substrate-binding protein, partial [Planctomycetota bacterium]
CPPPLMKIYNDIFDEFRRTHPDINLRVLHITGNYEDKIKVMVAGNVAPDTIFMYPSALAAWVELDALEPLDTNLAADPKVGTSDYFTPMIDTFSYEGKVYGLPKDASAVIMQYNVDLFRRFGVEPPRADWTWYDMLDAAGKLTRDTDGDGRTDLWGMTPYSWWIFVWQNGGRILSEDRSRCVLLEPRAIEALEFWAALRYKHGVTPTLEAEADMGMHQMFIAQRVAMSFEIYPIVSVYRKTCEFEWDLAHVPAGPAGRCTEVRGSALAMSRQCRNREAAFEFVRWLTAVPGMSRLLTVEMPSWKSLADSDAFVKMPGLPSSKHVAVESMEYARLPLQHPLYNEIMDALNPALQKAQRGEVTVREALEQAVPQVNKILERHRARS